MGKPSAEWIDISVPIGSNLPVWPGDPPVSMNRVLDLSQGDAATVSRLSCGVHTGTHVDAPAHFLEAGRLLHQIPL
ncbi:MAG: cyclase family protein, partial [Vampirovibrionales bacterium]|nr:cyclase family protein [Vampirovibrionales bacterium]